MATSPVVSGKLTVSDYSEGGDRLWLDVNGGVMTVKRGWSPSQYQPLDTLGELPDEVRLVVLEHLNAIGKVVSEAYANWQI